MFGVPLRRRIGWVQEMKERLNKMSNVLVSRVDPMLFGQHSVSEDRSSQEHYIQPSEDSRSYAIPTCEGVNLRFLGAQSYTAFTKSS